MYRRAAGASDGAQIAVLDGYPDKPKPFVFRLKFPSDYKVAAHMQPNDYDVTVLSGTMYLGIVCLTELRDGPERTRAGGAPDSRPVADFRRKFIQV